MAPKATRVHQSSSMVSVTPTSIGANHHHHHQVIRSLIPAFTMRTRRRPSHRIICLSLVVLVSLISSHLVSCVPNQQPQHRTGTTDHSTDKQLLKKALDDQGNLSKSSSSLSSSSSSSNSNSNQHQQQQQASSLVANATTLTGQAVNFQCPEQFGYYTDSRDCTKYYVCVFGEVLHESCTGGLRFSRELQTCDWPRNVDCPQQSGANGSSTTTSTTTSLPPGQSLQLKVQAAAAAKESQADGSGTNASGGDDTDDDDEKPAAMKASSLVFADEGSDPQQPSFDEAVSPVITPDGAIHLHDGSGGTYSLQAGGAAAANAAGRNLLAPDGGTQSVDVFVKALVPAAASGGRPRSQPNAQSRRVPNAPTASNSKLLQPATLPDQRNSIQQRLVAQQQQQQTTPNHLSVNKAAELTSEPQDSATGPGEEQPGSGAATVNAGDDTSATTTGGMSDSGNNGADLEANQAPNSPDSIGAQADQTELAEERDSRAADELAEGAGGDDELASSPGGSDATTAPTTTTGYVPPVMASAAGLQRQQQQANARSQLQPSSGSSTFGLNGLASGGAGRSGDSSRQSSFVPSFKPPTSPQSVIDSGESDDNEPAGDSAEMNNQQQQPAESRSNGRQNLLTITPGRENQTTTTTTTLHQHHPHPPHTLQHSHQHHLNNLNINLQQQQQQQNTRQSRMSNNFKPQQFSHMQTNLNRQQIADMPLFDGSTTSNNGRQATSGGDRFQANINMNSENNNVNFNDSAKLIRSQSSHHQLELPAAAGSGTHFRPSQPFPSRSSSAPPARSQSVLFSQQPFGFAANNADPTPPTTADQLQQQLGGQTGDGASATHLPAAFNQQQRRPRPPKRQQIPQGTNSNNSRKPLRPPMSSAQLVQPVNANNDQLVDQQQQPPATTMSSQIASGPSAVMQSPGSATTAGQFLPAASLPSTPAHRRHPLSHQQHQQQQRQALNNNNKMFTTSPMMDSNGQQTTRSASSNANLPPFSQQITRPIVAPTTINFQQDFAGSPTATPTASMANTATTIGARQRFSNGNQHVDSNNNNIRNLQGNSQGQRAAQLLAGESFTERPAANLLITTTSTTTSTSTTTAGSTDGLSNGNGNDQDQDPELQIDPASGNSVGGAGTRSGSAGLQLVNGSESDLNVNPNSNLDSNTNSNQNQAAAAAATTTTTANQEQDPQLVANRYLNSAIDALEAGQPFGTVDYDFDILNDNSTDNRRNPTSSTDSSSSSRPSAAAAAATTSRSPAQSNAQSNGNSNGGGVNNNKNDGLFYSNPTNANKQRQRPNQQSAFNRHQHDGGSEDGGESISLTNGQPTSGNNNGVATNNAGQIGLNARAREPVRAANANGASGGGGGGGVVGGTARQPAAGHSFAAQPNQQVSKQRGEQLASHLSAASATPSAGGSSSSQQSNSAAAKESLAAVSNLTPTKKPRPTNKKISVNHEQALANNRASIEPAKRPEALFSTPTALQPATKCDNRVCRLPDCKCGDTLTPGGLDPKVIPQVILLTFDDAVNDLNWEIYEELFTGRTNPNGCPVLATFYVSHEWTDYGQVQTLYSRGHEMASHSVTHSFGEKFSKNQWFKEVNGQREILNMYGGVKMNDVRGMRAPFLQIGGNKMFEMLYDANFTYDSSMPIFENSPPLWPYTLDYQMTHECMITPCPTKSFPGVWEVGMTMWVDLRGGRCSMGDACSNPPDEDGVYEMLMKNFNRHYKSNRAPFGLFYHSAWFNTVHHRRGFLRFMGTVNGLSDVFFVTNWQMLQWMRKPTPLSEINSFEPWQCPAKNDRPPPCYHPSVCNVKSEHGTRFMKTCQPCPSNQQYPWVGATGFKGKQANANGSG